MKEHSSWKFFISYRPKYHINKYSVCNQIMWKLIKWAWICRFCNTYDDSSMIKWGKKHKSVCIGVTHEHTPNETTFGKCVLSNSTLLVWYLKHWVFTLIGITFMSPFYVT